MSPYADGEQVRRVEGAHLLGVWECLEWTGHIEKVWTKVALSALTMGLKTRCLTLNHNFLLLVFSGFIHLKVLHISWENA